MIRCEKVVFGEIELLHRYSQQDTGELCEAKTADADGDYVAGF